MATPLVSRGVVARCLPGPFVGSPSCYNCTTPPRPHPPRSPFPSFRLEEHEELTDLAALQRFDPRLADAAAGLAASSNALQRVVSRGGSSSRVLSQASSFKRESEEGPQRSPGDAGVGTLSSHLMDFWTNLCICQSLILEDDPKGDKPLYQV